MPRADESRPTTTGVSLRDLGPSVVTLARGVAGIKLPMLRASSPVFVTWGVTEACNLACAHCNLNRPLPDELTHEQRLDVAHKLAASDAWGVSLIGGEPLLVKGLFDYARILKAAGKRVFLGTSGDKLGRFIDEILDVGIDVVTLSIEGADAEAHDKFRKRVGLFSRVLESVDTLVAKRKDGTPRLQVRCTINRHNFRQLDAVMSHWEEHVDNVLLQPVQNNCLHTVRDRSVLFQPEDRAEFELAYAAVRERHPILSGTYFDLLPRFLFEPEKLQTDIGFRCLLVPATTVIVLANGKVKFCHGRPDSEIGTIVDSSLRDLWSSDQAQRTRRTMQSKDYGCMCWEGAYAPNLDLVTMSRHFDSVVDMTKTAITRFGSR